MTKPTLSPAPPICTTPPRILNSASAVTRSPAADDCSPASSRGRFIEFLRSRLDTGVSGAPYADRLLRSAAAPSRQLLTVVAEELAAREQFVLLDEQAVAFDLVMHAVEEARASDQKTAVIITGGPGSGKSVIALSLMGALAAQGRTVVHATGSRAFTQTLRDVSGFRKARAGTVFKYFNSFMDAERNGLDVLILDEAHRIRETSVNRYTRAASCVPVVRRSMNCLATARVPVFLLDQHQVVRPGEMGTARRYRPSCAGCRAEGPPCVARRAIPLRRK